MLKRLFVLALTLFSLILGAAAAAQQETAAQQPAPSGSEKPYIPWTWDDVQD